ncbi:MAG: histidine phosphatase family protein [Burkholderiales bacterium]|nr:histidine phosphatase family protein [Burkholderiales bacterium]
MDIIFWRHAEAEDGGADLPDADRKLTAKGRKHAKQMARWLESRMPQQTTVYASPTRRTRQTARALTKQFETLDALGADTTAAALLKAVGWPRIEGAVLIVGHQPSLGQAAAKLLSGRVSDINIKKGALWWFSQRDGKPVLLQAVISPDLL